jgi:hypothetical protein
LSYFVLDLTNEGVEEDDAVVNSHYYVIYIFSELFFQIAEFAILVVVARTVNLIAFRDFANPASHRVMRFLTFFLIGTVATISIITYGLFAGYYSFLANGLWANNLVPVTIGFIVAYGTVYSAASLFMTGVAIIAVARQRSKVRVY